MWSASSIPQPPSTHVLHACGRNRVLLSMVLTFVALTLQVFADTGSTATHVSTLCELQRALADASVVHVVVTEHLYFDSAVNCNEAGVEGEIESVSSKAAVECATIARQNRDSKSDGDSDRDRDRNRDEDSGEDNGCIEEVAGGEATDEDVAVGEKSDDMGNIGSGFEAVETVKLPLHVAGAMKTIRVCSFLFLFL